MNDLIPMQCDNCNINCHYAALERINHINGFDIQFRIICKRKKFVIASKIISTFDFAELIHNIKWRNKNGTRI